MSAIFISHSSNDDVVAGDVKTWLVEQGHGSVFLDFDPEVGIPAGRSWEQELYQQLRTCRAVIVLCSESSMSSRWCFAEITHARSLGKPVFSLKIGPCEVDPMLTDRQIIDLTQDRAEGFERLLQGMILAGIDATNPFDWDGGRPPYPGLLCFGEEDAAVFFGRDQEIGAGLDALTQMRRYGGAGLLLLLGASGSGKSSMMRAGMVPRLRRDPEQWLVVDPFRPGDRPLANLAGVLAKAFDRTGRKRDWREVRDALASSTEQTYVGASLIRDLRLGSKYEEASMVLFIDQFEELLGYPPDHPASRFLVDLRTALDPPRGTYLTVATLRSDYFATFQKHPMLRGLPFRSLSLAPLPVESLSEIIEKPAELAGLDMEPGLVRALLKDTEREDALPLLAFTLRELYELAKEDRHLGIRKYREQLGGLRGAVARSAESVLTSRALSKSEEEDLRGAFLGMVRLDDEGHFARRAAGWDRLPEGAHEWLERFIQARLLVAGGDDAERTVEVAHEALFRAWEKLASWLDENREALMLRQELGLAVRLWEQAGRADEDLWRGGRLERALELCGRSFGRHAGEEAAGRPQMAKQEREFLDMADKAQHRSQRRRKLLRRMVVTVSLVVATLMSVLFVQARQARDRARTQALAAQARGYQHERLDRALLLSLEVDGRGAGLEARRLLYEGLESSPRLETLLHRHRGDVRAVAWSPDGRLLASGSGVEPNLLLWDVASDRPTGRSLAGTSAGVWSLAFSPDGTLLAAGSEDGAVLLWDVYLPPGEPRRLIDEGRPTSDVYAVAWSPDGRFLAAARSDQRVAVWDVAAAAPAETHLSGASDWLKTLAWSPDGVTVAAAGMDKQVRRWNVETGELLAALRPDHDEGVMSLAYSPDGAFLASGSLDGTVSVWDRVTGERSGPSLDSLIGPVAGVAWSGDSRSLAVGGTAGRVALWDVGRRRLLAPTGDGQAAALLSIAWSPDGSRLASGNGSAVALWRADGGPRLGRRIALGATEVRHFALTADGATMAAVGRDPVRQDLGIRLWDVASGEPLGVIQSAGRRPPVLAWNVDSQSLLTADVDRKVRRWEVSTGRALAEQEAGDRSAGRLSSLAWSGGGKRLAIGGRDGRVGWWSSGAVVDLEPPLAAIASRITVLEWDAPGQRLAAGATNGGIQVWSSVTDEGAKETGRLLEGHKGAVTSLAWSPDGRILASAGRDRAVRFWDVASGRQDGEPLSGLVDFVTRLVWSPDGRSLASATNTDWRIQLWDVAARAPWAGPFLGHADTISGLWFSPNGLILTSVSVDGMLRHWDVDPVSWRRRACDIARRDLTREEWRRYLPNASNVQTCADLAANHGDTGS